ncbi:MAG: hypothetical protein LH614_22055 [Pyrinomonadaceae bacterium]|nr:hypothetical protein [Pyrinomonadaceae bacterium]
MGRWIRARQGDTFCSLAVSGGFVDCQVVRNHNANAAISIRQLQPRDNVYIPTITEGSNSVATERRHVFVRRGAPFAAIRFVRGGRDNRIPRELAVSHLQISNFQTDRGGTNATLPFAGAAQWQFDADSFIDPDAFKIEVSDRRATAATLQVEFQALHPIYRGTVVTGHDLNWSSVAERDRRKSDITVHRATPLPDQRYRSPYLRLIVDETDQLPLGPAAPMQTLLVTDDQPNEERVEILDQRVRATYLVQTCPIAGDARCRVTAEAPVGGRDRRKRRIKLCVGILRQNVGDLTGFNGITEPMIRHRLFRWVRRVYAQADMSPVLVAPNIRLLDPPSQNLIVVSDLTGDFATGTTTAGVSPSVMSFTITSVRATGILSKPVSINIPRPRRGASVTPIDIARLIVRATNDADFTAGSFQNAASIRSRQSRRSADVLIRDKQGGRVTISAVLNSDSGASLTLANVNLNGYQMSNGNDMMNGSLHERQLLRNYNSGEDRMDCYVVGQFQGTASVRGRSYVPGLTMPAAYRTAPEIVNSCVMGSTSNSGMVMDGGDNLPYTFPHEMGHALLDCFHTNTLFELMNGNGTSVAAIVSGTKRLCDVPVQIPYGEFDPRGNYVTGTLNTLGRATDFFAATRLGTISRRLFNNW